MSESNELTVGTFYEVRCVQGKIWSYEDWWPLLTDIHNDKEIIGFAYDHAHLDPRFMSAVQWRRYDFGFHSAARNVFSVPFQIGNGLNEGKLEYKIRRLKCKRPMPIYPVAAPPWVPALETAFATSVVQGHRCPHRGVDLSTCPAKNGVVTCPGHGLSWSITTGHLVPRNSA